MLVDLPAARSGLRSTYLNLEMIVKVAVLEEKSRELVGYVLTTVPSQRAWVCQARK